MTKYENIYNEIQRVKEENTKNKKEIDSLISQLNYGSKTLEQIKKDINTTKNKEIQKEIETLNETIKYNNKLIIVLTNNLKTSLYNDALPKVLEILSKYNNKPYGEKTRKKIRDEIFETLEIRFYITKSYSNQYYELDYKNINVSIGGVYEKDINEHLQILINNKIVIQPISKLQVYYETLKYINDIKKYIETLEEKEKEISEKEKELNTIIKEYNNILISGFSYYKLV